MTDINPRQLVFIDARVPNLQDLLDGLEAGEQAFVLDASRDGVQQIADALAANNFAGLSSISIVSHADTGTLDLGSSVITDANLAAHSKALAEIGASLAPGGNIRLYGCDVAQGAAGQQFINDFSTFAGGAEVDASTHLVGSAALGGSWTLNAASNGAGAPSNGAAPFTSTALANFNGTLDSATDPEIWTAIVGPNGLVHADDTGSTAVNTTTLYAGNTNFHDTTQVVLDPTDGLYFVLDHTAGGDVILEGSLTQTLANPSAAPTFSTLFADTNTANFIPEIALDTVNHQLYFVDINGFTAGTSEISQFERVNYNATGLTTLAAATVLSTVGPVTNGGVVGFALDLTNQEAVFAVNSGGFLGAGTPSSPNIPASGFLYAATGVTSSAGSVTMSSLPVGSAGNFTFDASLGFFSQDGGLAIDPNTHKLYFTLEGGSAGTDGGLYEYDLTSNTNGSFTVIWQETSSSSPSVALNSIQIDPTTNNWYVSTDSIGSIDIWKGSLSGGAPTVFLSFAGNGSAGNPQQLWLDQEPTLALTASTPTWTEEGANVSLLSSATAVDPDNGALVSATVSISSGFRSGDVLTDSTAGTSITSSYNSSTGVLTLTGIDTAAHYQSVLDSIQYHGGENPTDFSRTDTSRTLTWTVNDGLLKSATQTSSVSVVFVNDPPTLSGLTTASWTEEGSAATLSPSAAVTDADDLTLSSATVAITGGTFAGDADLLTADTTGTSITASYNAATETLTLSGSDTLAHYQTVLDKITFSAGENPTNFGSDPTRTVTWVLTDPSGTAAGGSDSTTVTSTINVTKVNDAPTLANVAASAQYTEEGGAVTLSNAISVADPDNLTLANATVRITGGTFAGDADVLAANTSGTNITANYNSTTETLTLTGSDTVADYQTVLDSVTFIAGENPNNFGSNPTRTVTWAVNDGSGSFNLSNVATTTLAITNVNDAPTLSNVAASASFTQGGGAVTLSGAASASDPDNLNLVAATVAITGGTFAGDGDVLAANTTGTAITASYNSSTETLTLTGSDTLAHYGQVLDSVTFNSTSGNPDDSGSFPTRTVTWVVNDGSASFNLSTAQTETINVIAVNQPPTLTGVAASASFTEEGGATTLSGNVTVADPNDTTLASATVSITGGKFAGDGDVLATSTSGTSISASYDSANERLVLSGTDTLAHYQSVLDKITFSAGENPTDYGSNPTRTLTWVLNDGHASNNLSTPQTETVNVTSVNDQPTLANVAATVGFVPHHTITISPSIAVSDPDNLTLANATVKITAGTFAGDGDVLAANTSGTSITASYNAATETLTLTGVDTVTHYQSVLDSVTFSSGNNPSNGNTNRTRTVTWVVNDGSGSNNLSTAATTTISISGSVRNDFNGDNKSDLLLQNNSSNHPDVMVELLNGTTIASSATISAPSGLEVEAAADFNNDGKADIVVQTSDGTPQIWLMNGTTRTSTVALANPGSGWHVIAADDFNSDGSPDLLFQNSNGATAVWLLNGTSVVTTATVGNPGASWHAIGAGDFNGDGNADILFQNVDNNGGTPQIWEMNGTSIVAQATLPNPGKSWTAIGTGDFNGDGMSDILFQNKDGTPQIWEMNGTSILTQATLTNPGKSWTAIGTSDFNGDGMADILYQNSDGTPLVWQMNGTSVVSTFTLPNPGSSWTLKDDGPFGSNSGPQGPAAHFSAPDMPSAALANAAPDATAVAPPFTGRLPLFGGLHT
jgi:lipopolysaccharide export system protein LptA